MAAVLDAALDSLSRGSDFPSNTSVTMMCWVKRTSDTNNFTHIARIRAAAAAGSARSGIQTPADGSLVEVECANGSQFLHNMIDGEWFFVGFKCNGTTQTGFVRVPPAGTLTTASVAAETFTVGTLLYGDRWPNPPVPERLNGRVACAKIYDAVLSDAEILTESNFQEPIRTANLHLWCPLDSTNTNQDLSGNNRDLTANGAITFDTDMPAIPLNADPVYTQTAFRLYNDDGTGLGPP